MRALELQRFLKNLPFIFNAPTWLGRPRFTGGLVKSARPLADSVAQGLVLFRGRRNTCAEMLIITKANSPATGTGVFSLELNLNPPYQGTKQSLILQRKTKL